MARCVPMALLTLVFLVCPSAAGVAAEKSPALDDEYYELYKLLVDTMDQVERNYVKDIDRRELMEAAIEGILKKLDPYSSYINPKEISRFRGTVESEFGGIGIQVSNDGGHLQVISPLVGTPAYRAGVLAGDRIVEIEGESTKGWSLDDAVRRLKGKEGTDVKLTVVHTGKAKKIELTITREQIHVETVLGDRRDENDDWDFMLEPQHQIGYIRVTAFSRDTAREIREAAKQLQDDELRALILDLRFNPGGLLASAIEISDLFIRKGRIVSTEGRNSPKRTWDAHKDDIPTEDVPMVVLVNRYSASASEIVSACLQDHGRAVVMGERTWGKGSVQNVIELEEGRSLLKLTTAGYVRPSGKNIHRFNDSDDDDEWGVTPDEGFRMRLGDAEIVGLMEDRRDRDIVRPDTDADEKPDADPAADEGDAEPEEANDGDSDSDDSDGDDSDGDDSDGDDSDGDEPDAEADPEAEEGSDTEEESSDDEESATGEEPEEPAFIDRQLRMAVEYLTGELARAE